MAAAEQEYVWMRSLSDTAGGTLSGKRKIELETYVQMAYFDRILRRANLRLMTMSSGQYELKRQEKGESKKEKSRSGIKCYRSLQRNRAKCKNTFRRRILPGVPFTGIRAF